MAITAKIDRPKLERSLKRFAKEFGENNQQAVVRWSIQTCRELAFETQVWGKKDPRKKQEGAIIADAYNVVSVVETLPKNTSNKRILKTPDEVNEWIEQHRTRRNRRTAKLPVNERKVCDRQTFSKAIKIRNANAGIAKGGWLGAGQEIAKAQRGTERINIGKNFYSYAQKHMKFGNATPPKRAIFATAILNNGAQHSKSSHVLSPAAMNKAINWGLKKTIKWYAAAMRRQNQSQKP